MSSVPSGVASPTRPAKKTEAVRSSLHKHLHKTAQFIKILDALVIVFAWIAAMLAIWLIACLIDHWVYPLPTIARWSIWLVGTAVTANWLGVRLIPLVTRRINPVYAARRIENLVPEFKNGLVSWLELESLPDNGVPRGVMAALTYRAARFIGGQDPSATVDTSHLIKLLGGVLLLTTSLVVYTMVSPKSTYVTGKRIAMPWSSIASPTRVHILEVTPGETEITQGKPLDIETELRGLFFEEPVFARFSTLDGQLTDQRIRLDTASEGHRYTGQIKTTPEGVEHELNYWIEAGDAERGPFRVTLSPLPTIALERITLNFPSYTKLEPRVVPADGDVEAVEGTRATISAMGNQPISRGKLEVNPEIDATGELIRAQAFIEMNVDDRQLEGEVLLRLNESKDNPSKVGFRIRGYNARGDANARAIVHSMSVFADVAPEVNLVGPESRQIRVARNSEVKLEIRASDPDYGLTKLLVEIRKNGIQLAEQTLLSDEGMLGRQVKTLPLNMSAVDARIGDKFQVIATAFDNRHDPLSGKPEPNKTVSEPLLLEVVGPDQADVPPQPAGAPPKAGGETTESETTKGQDPAGNNSEQPPLPANAGENSPDAKSSPDENSSTQDSQPNQAAPDAAESGGQQSPNPEQTGEQPASQNQQSSQQSGDPQQQSGQQPDSQNQQGSPAGGSGASQSSEGDPQQDSGSGGQSSSGSAGEQGGSENGSKSGQPSQDANQGPGNQGQSSSDQSTSSQSSSGQSSPQNSGSEQAANGASSGTSQSAQTQQDREAIEQVQEYMNSKPDNASGGSSSQSAETPPSGSQSAQGTQDNAGNSQSTPNGPSPDKSSENSASPANNQTQQDSQQTQGKSSDQGNANQSPQQAQKSGDAEDHGEAANQQNSQPGNQTQSNNAGQPSQQSEEQQSASGSQAEPQNSDAQPESQSSESQSSESQSSGSQSSESQSSGSQSSGSPSSGDPSSGSQSSGAEGEKSGDSSKAGSSDSQSAAEKQSSDGNQGQSGSSDPNQQPSSSGSQAGKAGSESSSGSPQNSAGADGKQPSDGEQGSQPGKQGSENQPSKNQPGSSDSSGEDSQSGSQAGESSQQPGQGSQSGSESEGKSEQGGEAASQPAANGQSQPGGESGSQSPGTEPGSSAKSSSPSNSPNNNGSRSSGGAPQGGAGGASSSGQAADQDYAEKTTELVLDYLNRQKDQPDPELLDELNWSKSDLQDFLKRWNEARDLGTSGDPQDRLQWQQKLQELGLNSRDRRAMTGSGINDQFRQQQDGGNRIRPPQRLGKQFEAFQRALQKLQP